jgi:hypothetical protein
MSRMKGYRYTPKVHLEALVGQFAYRLEQQCHIFPRVRPVLAILCWRNLVVRQRMAKSAAPSIEAIRRESGDEKGQFQYDLRYTMGVLTNRVVETRQRFEVGIRSSKNA